MDIHIVILHGMLRIEGAHLDKYFILGSKKQTVVTLSSAEVEYVAGTIETCQEIWMRRI